MSGGSPGVSAAAQFLLFVVLALCGCQCSTGALAILEKANGTVQQAASPDDVWQQAAVGAKIGLGGGVRTLAESTAVVDLSNYGLLTLEPSTTLRLVATSPGSQQAQLSVEAGVAILDSGAQAVGLRTTVGLARLSSSTQLRLERVGGEMHLSVITGLAQIGPHTLDESAPPLRVKVYWDPTGAPSQASPQPTSAAPKAAAVQAPVSAREVAVTVRGGAEIRPPGEAQFRAAPEGNFRWPEGTHLRLSEGAQVLAARGRQRASLTGTGSYVLGTPRGLLRVNQGTVKVRESGATVVEVVGGEAQFVAGAMAELLVDERNVRLAVARKTARVSLDGNVKRVAMGQVAVRSESGKLRVEGVSLQDFDLEAKAGDSLTVHDPRPPTRVGFRAPDACKARTRLRLRRKGAKRFASGSAPIGLALGAGMHRYELDCLNLDGTTQRAVQSGRVRVLRDAGSSQLARHPEASTIPLDGRPYTVLYEHQTPALRLSWAGGPTRAVSLTHIFDGERRVIDTGKPQHTFGAGALPEGEHQFVFQGEGRLSRATPVTLRRDTSGPVAQLEAPRPAPKRRGRFSIAGRVVPGAEVHALGRRVEVAPEGRILVKNVALSKPLAIWVRHPDRGTHVYLSRRQTR